MGKERSCLRGIDLIHGPTSNGISGNLMIATSRPINRTTRLTNSSHSTPVAKRSSQPVLRFSPRLSELFHQVHRNCSQERLTMFPEKRYFFETSTTEVAIHTNLFTDLYASIGSGSSRTGWYTTIMKLPFILLIRIGFFFASLGGSLGLLRQLQKDKLELELS